MRTEEEERVMIISVMQPYFFPYVGYFSLIRKSDLFVACDEVQHIKQGWVNRNRTFSLDKEFNYIRIELHKASQNARIRDLMISEKDQWKQVLMNQLNVYRKRAPYYQETVELLQQCFACEEKNLAKWLVNSLRLVCDYIGIKHNIVLLSEMDLAYEPVTSADEWGLHITKALEGHCYLNLPGGMSFYDNDKYEAQGVHLTFIQNHLRPYDQKTENFIPGLSIIDLLMYNSKEEILALVDDYELVEGKDVNQ